MKLTIEKLNNYLTNLQKELQNTIDENDLIKSKEKDKNKIQDIETRNFIFEIKLNFLYLIKMWVNIQFEKEKENQKTQKEELLQYIDDTIIIFYENDFMPMTIHPNPEEEQNKFIERLKNIYKELKDYDIG